MKNRFGLRFAVAPILLDDAVAAAELRVGSPLKYQVVQRASPGKYALRITAERSAEISAPDATIKAKLSNEKRETP